MSGSLSGYSPGKTSHKLYLYLLFTPFLWWLAGAFQVFPLGWFVLTPLFIFVYGQSAKARFKRGYGLGFLSFWLINWWLIPTIVRGSTVIGVSPVIGIALAFLAVTLIAILHAWLPALACLAGRDKGWEFPFVIALAWSLTEMIRTSGPLAYSWGALAFTQTSDPLLLPLARYVGQTGLTFLCVFLSAAAALWWHTRRKSVGWVIVGVLVGAHLLGLARVLTFGSAPTKPFVALVVQTEIASTGIGSREPILPQAWRLTQEALAKNPRAQLVVWPETTLRLQRRSNGAYDGIDWEVVRRLKTPVPLLTGAQTTDSKGQPYNEAVLIAPDMTAQNYAKTQLVPFGERPPLVEYLPFLQMFAPNPMLQPGQGPKLFQTSSGVWLRPAICFESCFSLPTRVGPDQAQALVVLTNDEWFTGTEAPRQHRAMGQLRAAENGLPLIQSCNSRYSFWVDGLGRIVASTTNSHPQTMAAALQIPLAQN